LIFNETINGITLIGYSDYSLMMARFAPVIGIVSAKFDRLVAHP
jgi:hypothetical protein